MKNQIVKKRANSKRPIALAIINQKGGVGKTTTSLNLGAALANMGYNVLMIDLDLQANLTSTVLGNFAEDLPTMYDVLLNLSSINEIIKETNTPNLMIAPSGENMTNVEINLASMLGREQALRTALSKIPDYTYDFIIMDNPPYLSLVTINAMTSADYLIVPVSCEYLPMLGLKWLLKSIEKIKQVLHPQLKILGFLLTMYDKRENITTDVEDILREQFDSLVYDCVVRINTKHKSAPAEQKTIFQYEASKYGRGTEDYIKVAKETLKRLKITSESKAKK